MSYFLLSLILAKILCRIMKKQSSIAVTIFAQELISLPFAFTSAEMVPLINTPKSDPMIFPTPPVRSVPPMTAEEMASISSPVACVVVPAIVFRQKQIPPIDVRKLDNI